MKHFMLLALVSLATLRPLRAADPAGGREVVIGCKKDVEGNVLAEIMAQLLEGRGFAVRRQPGLGSTLICFEALKNGAIDLYPEYSGTLEQDVLKLPQRVSYPELRERLKGKYGMDLLDAFGFENTYAIAVRRAFAEKHGLKTIGDLARLPDLRYGFSHEFLERKDGWPGLAREYGLSARPAAIAHGLAYRALHGNQIDVTDAYSTDGDIRKFDLVLLQDDRHFFPQYLAAPLARGGLSQPVKDVLGELAGRITEADMQALNGSVVVEQNNFAQVARQFLTDRGLLRREDKVPGEGTWVALRNLGATLLPHVATHLKLTALALLGAMAVAIPLGIVVYRLRAASRPVMYGVGVL